MKISPCFTHPQGILGESLQEALIHPSEPCEALFIIDGCALFDFFWLLFDERLSHTDFATDSVGQWICRIDQQKAAWFESDFCVSCASYIYIINNRCSVTAPLWWKLLLFSFSFGFILFCLWHQTLCHWRPFKKMHANGYSVGRKKRHT